MSWIDEAHMDLMIYRLKVVGRKNMTLEQIWLSWLERSV